VVESRVGEGTVFTIYLPALRDESAAPAAPLEESLTVAARLPAGGDILIMDDDPEIRVLLSELLGQEGYRVVAVDEGSSAVKEYQESMERGAGYDCLIMDLTIPGGMGGREAMARIREIDPGAKAIVSSGYSTDPVMADFAGYGFSGRVAKPYQLEELVKVIRQVLGR
jgi:CheY-like chemotaxis protein